MNTGIPEQVQAGADKADALIADLHKKLSGDEPTLPANQDPGPNKPEDAVETVESLTAKLAEKTQQFNVLQGKYNAEIKALGDDPNLLNTLKAENRNLKRQNSDFSKIISDQQHQLAQKPDEIPATKKVPESTGLSQDDLDHLRAEGIEGKTLEIFKKLAVGEADNIVKMRYGDLSAKVDTFQQDAAETKSERFFRALTEAVPTWRAINANSPDEESEWRNYLDGKAPFQNRTRNQVLIDAQDQFDVETCAEVFTGFISLGGGLPGTPIADGVVGGKDPLKINPADLLDPAASSSSDVPKDAPTYTMAEYKSFCDAATKNPRIVNTEAWIKKNAMYDKALSEGRIK